MRTVQGNTFHNQIIFLQRLAHYKIKTATILIEGTGFSVEMINIGGNLKEVFAQLATLSRYCYAKQLPYLEVVRIFRFQGFQSLPKDPLELRNSNDSSALLIMASSAFRIQTRGS